MTLARDVHKAASNLQETASNLASALESRARTRKGQDALLLTYRESEAIAITCKAVMEEARELLKVMDQKDVVGKLEQKGFVAVMGKDGCDVANGASRSQVTGDNANESRWKARGKEATEEEQKEASKACNGFDSIGMILTILLIKTEDAVRDVASTWKRWLVSVIEMRRSFEKMSAHHTQLRAFYGIVHLTKKIINNVNVKETLFVTVDADTPQDELHPMRWRNAIDMDEFYGRYFGFHYKAEMRNVLRIINIARGSVDKAIETAPEMKSSIMRSMAVLVWGVFYSNMTIMSHLGVSVEGASCIGSDAGKRKATIDQVRTFMNLVEDPVIAGVAGLTSKDVAIDKTFEIPGPPIGSVNGIAQALKSTESILCNGVSANGVVENGFGEGPVNGASQGTLSAKELKEHWTANGRRARKSSRSKLVFKAQGPVKARLVSYKMRPVRLENSSDPVLSGARRDMQEKILAARDDPSPIQIRSSTKGEKKQSMTKESIRSSIEVSTNGLHVPEEAHTSGKKPAGVLMQKTEERHIEANGETAAVEKEKTVQRVNVTRSEGHGNGLADVIVGAAEQSVLAKSIRSGLEELGSNLSIFFGLKSAEPADGLILHFHGGGFISQSSMSHSIYTKEWAADMKNAVVLSIDYSLAPEAQYPVALEECFYAYHWAIENCTALGTKAKRVVLTGDSAGGNLALAVALKAQAWGLRRPDGICIAYPALYVTMAWSPSRLLSFFDPLLPLSVLDLCLRAYVPDGVKSTSDPYISPLVATDKALQALPPVTVVVGSFDPLMDDAVCFVHRMRSLGRTDVRFKIFESMPHGFLNMIQVNPESRQAMSFLSKSIAEYLDIDVHIRKSHSK